MATRGGRCLQCSDRSPRMGGNADFVDQKAVERQLGLQEMPGAHLGHCTQCTRQGAGPMLE
eukprot:1916088-Pyramimonas_sp.AAC.1